MSSYEQSDHALRAVTRAIYEAVYPGEDWARVGFQEAERLETVHYRNAVSAAIAVRPELVPIPQLDLRIEASRLTE
jgi:hypothetical protein